MQKLLMTPSSSPSFSSFSLSPFPKKSDAKCCGLLNETNEKTNESFNEAYDKNKDINNNSNVDNNFNKNINSNNNNNNINNINNNEENFSPNLCKKKHTDTHTENDKGKQTNITHTSLLNSKHNTDWSEGTQMAFVKNQFYPSMDLNNRKSKRKDDLEGVPHLEDLQVAYLKIFD